MEKLMRLLGMINAELLSAGKIEHSKETLDERRTVSDRIDKLIGRCRDALDDLALSKLDILGDDVSYKADDDAFIERYYGTYSKYISACDEFSSDLCHVIDQADSLERASKLRGADTPKMVFSITGKIALTLLRLVEDSVPGLVEYCIRGGAGAEDENVDECPEQGRSAEGC